MIVGVIQARMNSTRLPGKTLADLHGKPLLWRLYERMRAAKELDSIVIATGPAADNRPIVDFAADSGIACVTGSEQDLIERYLRVTEATGASATVRVTGDCPLVDPGLIDEMVKFYRAESQRFDYVSNAIWPSYPNGLDLDIVSTGLLRQLDREARDPFWREWFIGYLREKQSEFKTHNIRSAVDLRELRWTVDYEQDMLFVRTVFSKLYPSKPIFLMKDILELLDREPELKKMNIQFGRDTAYYEAKKEKGK